MSTAQPLRRANNRHNRPTAKAAAQNGPNAPRVFSATFSPPDPSTLFNLQEPPGHYNALAKAALLRGTQRGSGDQLFIDFSCADPRVELKAAGQALLTGCWTFEATADGKTLSSAGDWTEICWHREESCDYLEIEMPLRGGWRLERQLFFARGDRFLLLADALIGPPSAEPMELRCLQTIPLAEKAVFQPAGETREGWLLSGDCRRASVVPPALCEWRAEFCHADFDCQADRLTLRQAALGRRLYAPLWIDLDARRCGQPITWRRLSVGENLAIVPRDVAVGYRIQVGTKQWILYRSLAPVGSRSVLGHNTYADFVCARFKRQGEAEEILAIE